MGTPIRVVCVCVGERYDHKYIAILQDMVARNLSKEHTFQVITEYAYPNAIAADGDKPGWWQKVKLFDPSNWEKGERIVYFDLDVVIIGDLTELVETKGIIRDWNRPGFNSSVMVWDHGEHERVWSYFSAGVMAEFEGDQDWIAACADGDDPWELFPREWFVSYRAHALDYPPRGCKAVIFHGKPDPHEVTDGWVPQVWKLGGLTELPVGKGMNVSYADALDNIRVNSAREEIPWFVGAPPHKTPVVIVGGAPSLRHSIDGINARRQRGAKIVALNNAGKYLNAHGIRPDVVIILDARPENIGFTEAETNCYLLGSQVHPSLFDALKDHPNVILFHAFICDEMKEVLEPYMETRPICALGGGGTVFLRGLGLLIEAGYRNIHAYGVDSCYHADEHHSYDQSLNDGDRVMEVTVPLTGKQYRCAPWMARQASEFWDDWPELVAKGVKLTVHGDGLIPDIWRKLRDAD